MPVWSGSDPLKAPSIRRNVIPAMPKRALGNRIENSQSGVCFGKPGMRSCLLYAGLSGSVPDIVQDGTA
jgi:hypothetical protein